MCVCSKAMSSLFVWFTTRAYKHVNSAHAAPQCTYALALHGALRRSDDRTHASRCGSHLRQTTSCPGTKPALGHSHLFCVSSHRPSPCVYARTAAIHAHTHTHTQRITHTTGCCCGAADSPPHSAPCLRRKSPSDSSPIPPSRITSRREV